MDIRTRCYMPERGAEILARVFGVVESDDPGVAIAVFQPFEQSFGHVGGRGLAPENPINRAWRDIHAISHHLGVTWDVQGRLHTAVALGLPSPDPKI